MGDLRRLPLHLAPHAFGERLDAAARLRGSGTLCASADGVQRVLGAAALAESGARVWWVRNGLGQTVMARLESAHACQDRQRGDRHDQPVAADVAVWRLVNATLPGGCVPAERDAFPGSPVYAWSYAIPDVAPGTDGANLACEPVAQWAPPCEPVSAPAAWPIMRMGFAGRVDEHLGPLLGVDTPTGPWSRAGLRAGQINPLGGPVFNARGRMVGMALPGAIVREGERGAWHPGPDLLWPASAMRALPWWPHAASAGAPARVPVDELYEYALLNCVQLIAA
jgi:hypothetical protein